VATPPPMSCHRYRSAGDLAAAVPKMRSSVCEEALTQGQAHSEHYNLQVSGAPRCCMSFSVCMPQTSRRDLRTVVIRPWGPCIKSTPACCVVLGMVREKHCERKAAAVRT